MTEQPEIPFILRDMTQAEIQTGRQGPMVFVFVAEIHQGDEQPLAREGFPMHWSTAKAVGMQIYVQACMAELEEIGFTYSPGGNSGDGEQDAGHGDTGSDGDGLPGDGGDGDPRAAGDTDR